VTRRIVLICRANLCRSPTAEVMLRVALDAARVDAFVTSAGIEAVPGQSTPAAFAEVALQRGIDLAQHVPVLFTRELTESADLVLTMTRDLLRSVVVATPTAWPRSFTLLELVRRGYSLEPPEPEDTLDTWLARVHATRDRAALLGTDPIDDVRDPMSAADDEGSVAMFEQLDTTTRRLARLLAVLSG
jgi:protein-tyrosine phosphatase